MIRSTSSYDVYTDIQPQVQPFDLNRMPNELWRYLIVNFLDLQDIARFSFACKRFRALTQHSDLVTQLAKKFLGVVNVNELNEPSLTRLATRIYDCIAKRHDSERLGWTKITFTFDYSTFNLDARKYTLGVITSSGARNCYLAFRSQDWAKDFDYNESLPFGYTPLFNAVENQSHWMAREIVKVESLLPSKAVTIGNTEQTALTQATFHCDRPMVKILMESNKLTQDDIHSALRRAIIQGTENLISESRVTEELLTDQNIDPNDADSNDTTLIMYACQYKQPKTLKELLKRGSPDLTTRDKSGKNAFEWAMFENYLEGVEILLQHSKEKTPNCIAAMPPKFFSRYPRKDRKMVEEAKSLLDEQTFDLAFRHVEGSRSDAKKIACALMNYEIPDELEAKESTYNQDIDRAFVYAAMHGRVALVRALCSRVSNIDCTLKGEGNSALLHGAERGREGVVSFLLGQDANANFVNSYNSETALHLAAHENYPKVCEILLKQPGINVYARDNIGNTPLIRAAGQDAHEVISLILKNDDGGINMSTSTYGYDRTALMMAAEKGAINAVKELMKSDKLTRTKINNCGLTALTIALQVSFSDSPNRNRAKEVVSLLYQANRIRYTLQTPGHLALGAVNQVTSLLGMSFL
ncbi:MAG: ankyrin repeat domain-containing protein [Chlamydiales bacterium]|nr:ankyrin repeat domain-containing protein [Chlamydiales bacterium]